MRKIFSILAVAAGLGALVAGGCTDAGDPVYPEAAGYRVMVAVEDYVGAWDNLHLDGTLTGDSPKAMDQDGLDWTATVEVTELGGFDYRLYYDDGSKAMVEVGGPYTVVVSEGGNVTGDTEVELEGNAEDGFRVIVYNGNPAYDNIKFKGAVWNPDWSTVERDGMSEDGKVFFRNVAGGSLDPGTYEWGPIHDDGTENGVWLGTNPNLAVTVAADGSVSGDLSHEIESPTPSIDVTFAVDMTGVAVDISGVSLAGGFGADGYAEWQPGAIMCTDADEDGVYEATLTLRQEVEYTFKFINGVSWAGEENGSGDCMVDNGYGGHNRMWTTPAVATYRYAAAWEQCPATK